MINSFKFLRFTKYSIKHYQFISITNKIQISILSNENNFILLNRLINRTLTSKSNIKQSQTKTILTDNSKSQLQFGFLFDIDGVLVRGKNLLPKTKESIKLITDTNGNFKIPTIFLTNAGNELRSSKAAKLSNLLGVKIKPDQVVMSHSPLKLLKSFHDKRCLISGQGHVVDIAKNLGFTSLITIDELRHYHPHLDVVDHKRRNFAPCVLGRYFPPIEAIILFGESIRWETNLQLIIDVLMSNGRLDQAPKKFPDINLPILACNTDMVWMAEAQMPRFGHGTFLHCLEQIYEKLSGRELIYSAIVGKPSEITYFYAEKMLNKNAKSIGLNNASIKRIYAVGDNLDTDIYGANVYNKFLKNKNVSKYDSLGENQTISSIMKINESTAESITSILVRTGVFQGDLNDIKNHNVDMALAHKDMIVDPNLIRPKLITDDVYEAVKSVFEIEKYKTI